MFLPGFVCGFVSLFVSLCICGQDNSKTLMKFSGYV